MTVKRRILKAKWQLRAALNYLHGYAFSPVQRCRHCDHTVYESDRRGCRYCQ